MIVDTTYMKKVTGIHRILYTSLIKPHIFRSMDPNSVNAFLISCTVSPVLNRFSSEREGGGGGVREGGVGVGVERDGERLLWVLLERLAGSKRSEGSLRSKRSGPQGQPMVDMVNKELCCACCSFCFLCKHSLFHLPSSTCCYHRETSYHYYMFHFQHTSNYHYTTTVLLLTDLPAQVQSSKE
jgi:hypothetical protein